MIVLYIVLLLSTLAVLGVAAALYWRVRRHAKHAAATPDETTLLVRQLAEEALRQKTEEEQRHP